MTAPKRQYHRLADLKRLREYATDLPVVVNDNGVRYVASLGGKYLTGGRYEVVFAYLQGWRDAIDANGGNVAENESERRDREDMG